MLWGLPWARPWPAGEGSLGAWNTNEVIMIEGVWRIKANSWHVTVSKCDLPPHLSLPLSLSPSFPLCSFPPFLPSSVLFPSHPLPSAPAPRWILTVSITLASLELLIWTRLALDPGRSVCLYFPSADIKGVGHRAWASAFNHCLVEFCGNLASKVVTLNNPRQSQSR